MTRTDDMAYELTVKRDFVAHHFLTVPNPGPEGDVHSHHFVLEVRFAGPSLDEYGYLVDIDDVNGILDDVIERYRETVLNDLEEFAGENPSVERFARVVGDRIENALSNSRPHELVVRLWEDDSAWASHRRELRR